MTVHLPNHTPDNEADWLDDLLRSVADDPEPDDAGFKDAVLRALPPQVVERRTSIGIYWINVCALAAASALLMLLLPTAVDLLAASSASQLASSEALGHLVPLIALLAWLAWWSLQRPFAD